jgi:hypothetical protein
MIKFFRQIRQKLFRENRFSEYLLYALGEILLVVVGILIALQINNWNEEEKNQKNEYSFFKDILGDLNKDSVKLSDLTLYYKNRIEHAAWLLKKVRDPESPFKNEEFGKHVEPLYLGPLGVTYNSSYEAAKSSGAFAIFKNEKILKNLNQFYADFEELKVIMESTLRSLESNLEPLIATIPENFIDLDSGEYVLTSGSHDNNKFYEFIADIEDQRNLKVDIKAFIQKPQFEHYLIGDLGRSFNALASIKLRKERLAKIENEIKKYLNE